MGKLGGKDVSLGISELIERKIQAWEKKKDTPEEKKESKKVKFYIAISRECGCDDDLIVEALQDATGFQKFDHEILDYMARNDEVRRKLYETIDDRTMGWIETMVSSLSMGPSIDQLEYFNRLTRALYAICHNTHAIILGRAANFILPREQGLAVRLVAPFKYRLERYAQRKGLDLKTAISEMERIDRGRGSFVEAYFGRYAFDPRRYDITINVSQFSVPQVVEFILLALKSKAGDELKLPVKQ